MVYNICFNLYFKNCNKIIDYDYCMLFPQYMFVIPKKEFHEHQESILEQLGLPKSHLKGAII